MLINPYAFAGGPPPPPDVTWNPLDAAGGITLATGDLEATRTSGSGYQSVRATKGIVAASDGYFEVLIQSMPVNGFTTAGIAALSESLAGFVGSGPDGWGFYAADGSKVNNGVTIPYSGQFNQGAIIGVAFKAGSLWFAVDNVWQASSDPVTGVGAAFTGITGTMYPMVGLVDPSASVVGRFKTADFSFAPPAGFSAWQ
jgi:hypothetical protein